ncbi:long-chain fatty acid--CoA ligase [Sulfitobacter sp. F26169L]|uniref:long-chain fatty acid--CoA ligase n=1 Tax=Sulfitobacter sp. F26169L TaxID=2996015 RepID=UPI002260CEF1|nr:long-chain fatty acid--CoA ligase [Sulfitobacter sp. F26169L]MCX7565085.1 long-chain fatty acid--CoA ligase [Sulfitobacter sp. F26169L]
MLGQMMHMPLTIGSLIDHAARFHTAGEIVSVETTGGIEKSTWGEVGANAHRLASALRKLGLEQGARCGTIAWNNRRHLEIYFGVAGGGFVCHTINPRMGPEQMVYVINHAEDQVLFIDATFVSAAGKLAPALKHTKHIVLLGPRDEAAAEAVPGLLFFDELLETGDPSEPFPDLDERAASSLCYTSGTTGNPKGVLYSHRSTVLHTLAGNQPDGLGISAKDTVLPVVPMFHVNAWGVPYISAMTGCKLVLPGPNLDGKSLVNLIDETETTMALGVPTIWMGLLGALKETGSKIPSLTRTLVGGSALPPSMIPKFAEYGVELIHGWGMTETSPLGTMNQLLQRHTNLSEDEQAEIRVGQGRPPFGVDLRVMDEEGNVLPHDGKAQGDLQIRGHWIAETYFGKETSALTDDGWFDTGDVATINEEGYMIIRDRSKDIIKSGGEWISTVTLENIAISHPAISNAAAIGAVHEKWDERPVVVAIKSGEVSEDELIAFYKGKVESWQIPDRVVFVDELPIGATGKVQKNKLRDEYGKILLDA